MGIDPRPFTLRQLAHMGRGRAARAWDHTAAILAMLANVNRDAKKHRRGYSPAEFHPFERRKRGLTPAGLHRLKGLFKKT